MIIKFKCDECGQYYRCNIDETHNYTTDTRWYNQGSKQIIPLDISTFTTVGYLRETPQVVIHALPMNQYMVTYLVMLTELF